MENLEGPWPPPCISWERIPLGRGFINNSCVIPLHLYISASLLNPHPNIFFLRTQPPPVFPPRGLCGAPKPNMAATPAPWCLSSGWEVVRRRQPGDRGRRSSFSCKVCGGLVFFLTLFLFVCLVWRFECVAVRVEEGLGERASWKLCHLVGFLWKILAPGQQRGSRCGK